jgi:hypothetical protein
LRGASLRMTVLRRDQKHLNICKKHEKVEKSQALRMTILLGLGENIPKLALMGCNPGHFLFCP